MTVIIRLQNLPWSATALDIRRFFNRLTIPDGGVHIVGGEMGDAFIAFATDEDARKAMMLNSHLLLENPVTLLLSSKTEMQEVIAKAREAHLASQHAAAPADYHSPRAQMEPSAAQSYGGPGVPSSRLDPYTPNSRAGPPRPAFADHGAKASMPTRSREVMGSSPWSAGAPTAENRSRRERVSRFSEREVSEPRSDPTVVPDVPKRGSGQGRESFGRGENTSLLGQFPQVFDAKREPEPEQSRNDQRGLRQQGERNAPGSLGRGPHPGAINPESSNPFGEIDRGFRGTDQDFDRPLLKNPDFPQDSSWEGDAEKRDYPPRDGPAMGQPGDRGFGRRGAFHGDSDGRNPDRFRSDENRAREAAFSGRDRSPLRDESLRDERYSRRQDYNRENYGGSSDYDGGRGLQPEGKMYEGDVPRGGFGPPRGRGAFRGRPDQGPPRRGRFDDESGGDTPRGRMGGEYDSHGGGRQFGRRDMQFQPDARGPGREDRPNANFSDRPDFPYHGYDDDMGRGRKREWEEEGGSHIIVENLPLTVSYRDVRRFFVGCEIPRDGLKLINNEQGQRIGVAYISFSAEHFAQEALYRDGRMMNSCQVRVSLCSAEDYESAVDSFVPRNQDYQSHQRPPMGDKPHDDDFCVEMSNAPFKTDKNEIKNFFAHSRIAQDGEPVLETGDNGRSLGVALVKFERYRDFREALAQEGKNLFGRTIRVRSISLKEFQTRVSKEASKKDAIKSRTTSREEDKRSSKPENSSTTNRSFTSPNRSFTSPKPLGKDQSGASDSKKPAPPPKAAEVSKEPEKKPAVKTETKPPTSAKVNDKKNGSQQVSSKDAPKKETSPDEKYFCVKMTGLPPTADGNYVREFMDGLQTAQRGIHVIYNHQRQAAGMAFVEFVTSDHCQKALAKNKKKVGDVTIEVTPIKKRDMVDEIQTLHATYRNPPSGGPGYRNQSGGVILHMKNVHFRAHVMDIVQFFAGFDISPRNVRMKFGPSGAPTGEATVMVRSLPEAKAIMRECNLALLMGRTIELDFK